MEFEFKTVSPFKLLLKKLNIFTINKKIVWCIRCHSGVPTCLEYQLTLDLLNAIIWLILR